jgi:hypothetical protein
VIKKKDFPLNMSVATRSTYTGPELPSTPKEETYYYWSAAKALKSKRTLEMAAVEASLDHHLLTRRLTLRECLSVDVIRVEEEGRASSFHRQRVPLPVVDWVTLDGREVLPLLWLDAVTKEVYLVARITEDDGSETVQRYMLHVGRWVRLQGTFTDLAQQGYKTRTLDWSDPPRTSKRRKK